MVWGSIATTIAVMLATASASFAWHETKPGQNGKIAFARGGDTFEIRIVNPDGTDEHRLTSQASSITLRWSPDGRTLAFSCIPALGDDPGYYDICTVASDGSANAKLTNDFGSAGPIWSSDGFELFFHRSNSLWRMNRDGSEQVPYPVPGLPSPDGNKALFSRQGAWVPDQERYEYDVVASDIDGTDAVVLSDGPHHDVAVDWSPDGRQILFTRNLFDHDTNQIWVVNSDGTGQRLLVGDGGYKDWIRWSPDGSMISFQMQEEGPFSLDRGIHVVRSDGSGLRRLTLGNRSTWSPDGKKLAFGRFVGDFETRDVFTINVDGTEERHIVDDPYPDDSHPSWQPLPNLPPDCDTVAPDVGVLPGDKTATRPVSLSGTDPDGDDVTVDITAVSQDESLTGWRDHTSPDAFAGDAQNVVRLRAESSNKGDGRVYRVAFEASDGHGGQCSGMVKVTVPRKGEAIDSAPPNHDSFGQG